MANDTPPKYLLPRHVVPACVLPTHRLWPYPQTRVFPPLIEQNGRHYQGFRRGAYPFPCDEAEQHRLDLFHSIFLLARNWLLHARPLPQLAAGERIRILDLGTGTGAWAVKIAEKYQEAEVVGLDLANIQPTKIPRNLRFQVPFDLGGSWVFGKEKSWDLIHLRCGLGSVYSWSILYKNILRQLKPDGVYEQVEIDLQPRWDNGNELPRDHPFRRWFDTLLEATTRSGRSIGWRQDTEQLLLSRGFVDIRSEVIRLPITPRPLSHRLNSRLLSEWYTEGLLTSLEALSLEPFTENLGWTSARVHEFIDVFHKILRDMRDEHLYNNMHVVTAKRPPA